ncbi:MAG TPA: PmoA family protein [Chryseolinea sp.]|nr:PmoA family protein [Chryseolinea sp.]HPM28939.1 PmoA family protein [Chryseolinea sp.]
MKKSFVLTLFVLSLTTTMLAQKKTDGFRLVDNIDEKQINVLYNDKLLTAYYYADSIKKPVLYPINTLSGLTVTRGFPIAPREGELVDHPHHIGMWLNYEYVNGLDFWNNSTAIPYKNRAHYGTIVHDGVVKTESSKTKASLEVTARWIDKEENILLRESTRYVFSVEEENFIIDRITTVETIDEEVKFNDVKDGFFAIRVARELQHPSDKPEVFVDSKGIATTVPAINNEGITGEYLSSEGIKGKAVWGTRARWVSLSGEIQKQPVSITIIDHSKNIGYPTYWHARGYGLFAANPLGQKVFSEGKEKLNLVLKKGESITFRYRVVIRSASEILASDIEALEKEFEAAEK